MIYKYFDDIEIGEKVVSRGRTVTETDVVNFCMLTGNWYPLHCDAEYAKKTQFGERIVQGSLVFAIMPGLLEPDPWLVIANYGYDRMRFTTPVKIGDTIHVVSEVVEKQAKGDDRGVVAMAQEVRNQRDETVLSLTTKFMVRRKTDDLQI